MEQLSLQREIDELREEVLQYQPRKDMEIPVEFPTTPDIGFFGLPGIGKSALINAVKDDLTAQKSSISADLGSMDEKNLLLPEKYWNSCCIPTLVENSPDDLTGRKSSFARDHSSISRQWENPPEYESSISWSSRSIRREVENLPEYVTSIFGSILRMIENLAGYESFIPRSPRSIRTEAENLPDDFAARRSSFSTYPESIQRGIQLERKLSISMSLRIRREVEILPDDLIGRKSSFAMDHCSIRREWENPPGETPRSQWVSVMYGDPADNLEGWPPFYIAKASNTNARVKFDKPRRRSFSTSPPWLNGDGPNDNQTCISAAYRDTFLMLSAGIFLGIGV